MKSFLICAVLGLSGVLFGEETVMKLPELLEYKGVTVTKIEPDGISIMHETGLAKVPYEKLTPELQAKFGGFDATKAAEFRNKRNKSNSTYMRAMDVEKAMIDEKKAEEKIIKDNKMPTKVEVMQATANGGMLCKVSFMVDTETKVRGKNAFGETTYTPKKGTAWASMGDDWFFVIGLPTHLVDGSNWEGFTMFDGNHAYSNTAGAAKTVRKLRVVE